MDLAIRHMSAATTLDEAHYTYDSLGQITSMRDPEGTHTYTYDQVGQLTAVDHPGVQPDETFTYDAAGNRTSNGEIHDAANRLLLDNDFTYTYDNEGNLLAKTDRSTSATTTFEWDANQRQRSVTTPTGETTTYRYDPRGRRIEVSSPAATERFAFGTSSNPLFQYGPSDSIEESYLFGFGSDKPLAMRKGGQSHFHLQDMLANVTSLTSSSGSKVESYQYSAFGKQTTASSPSGNRFTFAGREWDQESATYYNRARQLDPSSGRFTSEDPIASSNAYPYAGNDPVSSRDPTGLFSLNELNSANSIRGELASEQVGFGLNLIGTIIGGGPDKSDMVTTAGAGVGAAGGFGRLARALDLLWIQRISHGHAWVKHADEFPEIGSPAQFSQHIDDVVRNGVSKQLDRGRTAHYDPDSGTIVVKSPRDTDGGTAFRPRNSKKGPRDPQEVFDDLT